MARYKCNNCAFSTDDPAKLVDHKLKERLAKARPQPSKKAHGYSAREFLDCPECRPKFEDAFRKRGYTKVEGSMKPQGNGKLCPDCGGETERLLLGRRYCRKCKKGF